jgi:hypothetical protein
MRHAPRRRQRGAVAIIVGLSLAVLIGAVGLALDGGRLYVNKTETQNAADACALAASLEMSGAPAIPLSSFPLAEASGRLVATRNRANFQAHPIANADITVEFSNSLTGSWVSAGSATGDAKYVRCTIAETGIAPWFMQVLGFGNQTVNSLATASLVPSQANCPIPLGVCAPEPSASPPYGLEPGKWYTGGLDNSSQLTGNFVWIDFTPPSGGASELAGLLAGSSCPAPVSQGTPVGQTGAITSLRMAWNSRFGIYHPSIPVPSAGATTYVADFSGHAYTSVNWLAGKNAAGNFTTMQRPNRTAYGLSVAQGNADTGLTVSPAGSVVLQPTNPAPRASRRIATAPIVNCSGFESSQVTPIKDWACVLMLHPMTTAPSQTLYLEFIGLAGAPGSPCASYGGVGSGASGGPLVPGLVQ